jgi:hypothetical protein
MELAYSLHGRNRNSVYKFGEETFSNESLGRPRRRRKNDNNDIRPTNIDSEDEKLTELVECHSGAVWVPLSG